MLRKLLPALLGMVALTVGLGPGAAQTAAPPTDVGGHSGTVSDKLHANDGVIHPEGNLDPGMQKPAPQIGTMPVVPTPGGPGGDESVIPK